MLPAERVGQRTDAAVALFTVVILPVVDVVGGAKEDVVVDVPTVGVGRDDVGIFSFENAVGELDADLMSFIERDFTRREGLDQVERQVRIGLVRPGECEAEVIRRGLRVSRGKL